MAEKAVTLAYMHALWYRVKPNIVVVGKMSKGWTEYWCATRYAKTLLEVLASAVSGEIEERNGMKEQNKGL